MIHTANARFLDIAHHEPQLPWRLAAHSHPFHEMILVLRGGQHVRIANREIVAKEGEALFYPRGVPHEEWAGRDEPLLSLFLSFDWPSCPSDAPFHVHDADGRMRVLAGWLHEERRAHSAQSTMTNETLFRALLAEFLRQWRHTHTGFAEDVRGFVRANIHRRVTVAELARVARMSKYHFIRKYRLLTGRTPMHDVRMLRVQAARDMILTTPLPLKEIAPKAGLGDVYHMSKLFKRHMNTTPGKLRRKAIRGKRTEQT